MRRRREWKERLKNDERTVGGRQKMERSGVGGKSGRVI